MDIQKWRRKHARDLANHIHTALDSLAALSDDASMLSHIGRAQGHMDAVKYIVGVSIAESESGTVSVNCPTSGLAGHAWRTFTDGERCINCGCQRN